MRNEYVSTILYTALRIIEDATKKKFSVIVTLHKSGQSWAGIAKTHNVTLKGSSELIKEMQKP